MAAPKLSGFLIALVWVSFFAAIFGTIITGFTSGFGGHFDNSKIDIYNKMSDLNSSIGSIHTQAKVYSQPTGIIDIIGGYMSQAYKTLVVSLKSLDIFQELTFSALSDLNIPAIEYLKSAIILTMVIIIVIGVMLSALVKKDL